MGKDRVADDTELILLAFILEILFGQLLFLLN